MNASAQTVYHVLYRITAIYVYDKQIYKTHHVIYYIHILFYNYTTCVAIHAGECHHAMAERAHHVGPLRLLEMVFSNRCTAGNIKF